MPLKTENVLIWFSNDKISKFDHKNGITINLINSLKILTEF